MISPNDVKLYFESLSSELGQDPELLNFFNILHLNLSDAVYLKIIEELVQGNFAVHRLRELTPVINDDAILNAVTLLKNEPAAVDAKTIFSELMRDQVFDLYIHDQAVTESVFSGSWNLSRLYDCTSFVRSINIDETGLIENEFHSHGEIRDSFEKLKLSYPVIFSKLNTVMSTVDIARLPRLVDEFAKPFNVAFYFIETGTILSGFRNSVFLKNLLNQSYKHNPISLYSSEARRVAVEIATKKNAEGTELYETATSYFEELLQTTNPNLLWNEFLGLANPKTFNKELSLFKLKYYYIPRATCFISSPDIVAITNQHRLEMETMRETMGKMHEALMELHKHIHLITKES